MERIAQRDLSVNGSRVLTERQLNTGTVSAELQQANQQLQQLRRQGANPLGSHNRLFNPLRIAREAKKLPSPSPQPPAPKSKPTDIKAHPSLLLGMLQHSAETCGRIWLLCRALDEAGQGWLHIDVLRAELTHKQSELRVCGWRRLRQILQQGNDTFWQRDAQGRVWLFGVGRVAQALGVQKLLARPIALPIHILTQKIQHVRAHFYAAFHSGRTNKFDTLSAPIARETLASITHTNARSQRRYDNLLKLEKKACFALGPTVKSGAAQEQAWQRGRALFNYVDRSGKFGSPGQNYLAWHLPNMYGGCHKRLQKGRQHKINRRLRGQAESIQTGKTPCVSGSAESQQSRVDLVEHIRAQGNNDASESKIERVFFPSVKQAYQREKHHSEQDHYWPQATAKGRAQVWLAVSY